MSEPIARYAVRKDALIRESEMFPPEFPHDYLELVVLASEAEAHEDAAVAEAEQDGYDRGIGLSIIDATANAYERGQQDERAKRSRVLAADAPEPAVGSVVLVRGHWSLCRGVDGYWYWGDVRWAWDHLLHTFSGDPIILIHDTTTLNSLEKTA